jgi:hypothetical protein
VQPASLVNTTTAGQQVFDSIGAQSDGGYTAAWSDNNTAVAIQRYDSAGGKVGTEVSIPFSRLTTSAVNNSAVTVLRDGSVVVVYETTVPPGIAAEALSFQRFDANGAQLSGETTVLPRISNLPDGPPMPGRAAPRAAALADGGFVVTWNTYSEDPQAIFVTVSKQRYDSKAQPVGGVVFVTRYTNARGVSQLLVADREGGYTLTMFGVNNPVQNFPATTVIHFDAADAATTIVALAQLSPTPSSKGLGDYLLLPLAGDRFVLFTREFNFDDHGFPRTDSPGILRQFLDSAGNPVGDATRIASMPVDAIELADGSFVVFTQDGAAALNAQRFDASGGALGDPVPVNAVFRTNAPFFATGRGVAALSGGALALGWSATPPGGDADVFTQRVLVQN